MSNLDHPDRCPTLAPLVPAIPGMAWTENRAAAVELASYGWPVLPGTYQLAEHGVWLGKHGAAGLEPASALWQVDTTTDPDVAMEWWTRRPYSVLLACGVGVDAVELFAPHGQCALTQLSPPMRGPVAATPFGSWLFFVRSDDEPLRPELAATGHAQLHARGAWLPIPPTAREGLPYRWQVPPSEVGWVLPASADVQRVLVASLSHPADSARPSLT
ncbi:bifunctional DNA primase/polymerase [Saccharomonospora azurea]|uniref:bifunctional DNA primase/polymerase n=1 Tax=Saccharomonospora azurea TaxID=40988 RepID=UPI000C1FD372|nr:bifunctional DNA primase/polymerase [Saccharomonospora azurea]